MSERGLQIDSIVAQIEALNRTRERLRMETIVLTRADIGRSFTYFPEQHQGEIFGHWAKWLTRQAEFMLEQAKPGTRRIQ